jgi:hypothetical protein
MADEANLDRLKTVLAQDLVWSQRALDQARWEWLEAELADAIRMCEAIMDATRE